MERLHTLSFWTLLGFACTVSFSKALANIFIVATAVLWLAQCVVAKRILFPRTGLNWLILVFFLSLFLSFLETSFFDLSIRGVTKVLQRFGLFFLALHVLGSANRLEKFVRYLSVGFGIILLSGFVQLIWGSDFIRMRPVRFANQLPRLSSAFEFPNQYGIYLVFFIFLYGFMAWDKMQNVWWRVYYSCVTFAGLFSLFMTHSRSAWASCLAALFCISFYFKRGILIAMTILSLTVAALIISPSDVLIHKDAEGKEQSISERLTLWDRAFEMIKAHPLTGAGINTYSRVSDSYAKDDKANLAGYYAHNSYLQMAAESGLITLGLFISILGGFLIILFRKIRLTTLKTLDSLTLKAVTLGIIAFLVVNMFETSFFSVQMAQLFYFFLALGVYLTQKEEEKIKKI